MIYNLRKRREILEADRNLIAKMLKIAPNDVADLEEGRRIFDPVLVYRLAKLLEVPIYWFFEGLSRPAEELLASGVEGQIRASQAAGEELERTERAQAMMGYFEAMDLERQAVVLDLARLLTGGRAQT